MSTPQQRTRDNLTARGYLVGSVERRKKFPDRKKGPCRACGHQPMIEISSDLWEVFDIVAVMPIPLDNMGTCIRMGRGHTKQYCDVYHHSIHGTVPEPEWRLPGYTSEIIFVQTTSRANHSTRRNKILGSMEAKLVLLSGARILLQSWALNDKNRWEFKDEWITLKEFESAHFYPNTVAELAEIKRKAKRPDLPAGATLPLA